MLKDQLDVVISDLIMWEGIADWMYLDSVSESKNVTAGIGCLLTLNSAKTIPWHDSRGRQSSMNEIEDEYHRVQAIGQTSGSAPRHPASFYLSHTRSLRFPIGYAREMAELRLENEFLPACRRIFKGFDGYPFHVQRAIVDMIWNLGPVKMSYFVNFKRACEIGRWDLAAKECHRSTSRETRNKWTAAMIEGDHV